jgi:succinate dehydrogenase / fumarate reductase membrane anchor subunit
MLDGERSFATEQRRVRGLGASGSGTGNFIVERVTSVALTVLAPYVMWVAITTAGTSREYAISWIGWWGFAPFLALFIVISAIHMRIGMQVIIEDYVHTRFWKITLLLLNSLFCWLIVSLSLFAILVAAFLTVVQ